MFPDIAERDGEGNQTSKVVPREIVAIPWPEAMCCLAFVAPFGLPVVEVVMC
jgi:hypothetical protein